MRQSLAPVRFEPDESDRKHIVSQTVTKRNEHDERATPIVQADFADKSEPLILISVTL